MRVDASVLDRQEDRAVLFVGEDRPRVDAGEPHQDSEPLQANRHHPRGAPEKGQSQALCHGLHRSQRSRQVHQSRQSSLPLQKPRPQGHARRLRQLQSRRSRTDQAAWPLSLNSSLR